jgi:hypothetical protein
MKTPNLYYPVALIFIIIVSGYMLYTGFFKRPQVDLPAYQKLCNQYVQAPAGTYSHDQMQLLVYKINYLFPDSVDKLTVPAERQLKTCATTLTERLKQTK